MPEKTIQTALKADRVKYTADQAKTEIKNMGIKVDDLSAQQITTLGDQFAKGAKKVEFVIGYKAPTFTYLVRAGSIKYVILQTDIAEDSSIADKGKTFEKLKAEGVATQADVDAFKNKQALAPLKKQIEDLKKKIKEAEDKIKPDRTELQRLEKEYKEKGGK
jgi:hypothetical protein